jgi:hypothetical protein
MAVSGMNLAEVRHLADQLNRAAEQLRTSVSIVDGRVHGSSWAGHDADQFKHSWWPGHRQLLLHAADSLQGLAASARNNADEQERASTSNGTSSYGGAQAGASADVGPSLRQRIDDAVRGTNDVLQGLAVGIPSGLLAVAGLPGQIREQLAGPVRTVAGALRQTADRLPEQGREALDGLAKKVTPALKDAGNFAEDLSRTPVGKFFTNPENVEKVVGVTKSPVFKFASGTFGFLGIAGDGLQAYEDRGDTGSMVADGVDVVADGLKMIPSPWTYGAGVLIDAGTDAYKIHHEHKSWWGMAEFWTYV